MLDVVYILTAVAVFALVGLIGRGVERLTPRPDLTPRTDASARPAASRGDGPR